MSSWGSFCVSICFPSVPIIKYKIETHFWPHIVHGRSPHKTQASITFWHFVSHLERNWQMRVWQSRLDCSVRSAIGSLYFGCFGKVTFLGFSPSSVSIAMLPDVKMESCSWIFHFSCLIGGFEVDLSQKSLMERRVFPDQSLCADCAVFSSERLLLYLLNSHSGQKFCALAFVD